MPCTSERSRMEDKHTAWRNAYADVQSAKNAALTADAAMAVACGAAIYTAGGGGFTAAACAAAVAALAYALNELANAREKNKIAADAYRQAKAHYDACMAKFNKTGP